VSFRPQALDRNKRQYYRPVKPDTSMPNLSLAHAAD
jgi:hypothetical protein